MWPSAMSLDFIATASRSDSSSTFFARGVKGMWPAFVEEVVLLRA
jgi:hypothetical protein